MKFIRKLAAVIMAAAIIMIYAPTEVNAAAIDTDHLIDVKSVSFTGIKQSIQEAAAGKKPVFYGKNGTIDPSTITSFGAGTAVDQAWYCMDTTITGDNSVIYSDSSYDASTFQFLPGKTYVYDLEIVFTPPTDYTFTEDTGLSRTNTSAPYRRNLNQDELSVIVDTNTTITDLIPTSGGMQDNKFYYKAIVESATSSTYSSDAKIAVYINYQVTIPSPTVTVDSVDFSGVSTSLASAKAGSSPTFSASAGATITPSDGVYPRWNTKFEENWMEVGNPANSTNSKSPNTNFKFEAGKSYVYYAYTHFMAYIAGGYVLAAAHDLKGNNTDGYVRVLTADEIKVKADGSVLPLASKEMSEADLLNPPDTLTGVAEVVLPNDDTGTYVYKDYDPDTTLQVGYYQKVTIPALVPSVTVTDAEVKGTVGSAIEPVEFTINASNMKFVTAAEMANWASIDGNSFTKCINLPAGLEVSYVSSSDTYATFKIIGTPTEAKNEAIKITIPKELIISGTSDLLVTPNTNAKYEIVSAASDTGDKKSPDTGDGTMLGVWTAVFLLSICTAGIGVLKSIKRSN